MTESAQWTLLPPATGTCKECAVEHSPDLPHNRDSLYYVIKYNMEHGRAPTWADAMEHCSLEVQIKWERELRRMGHWDDGGANAKVR
jgi:hypothetical protein